MAFVTIDGEEYEGQLIDLAKKYTSGRAEGRISRDEAEELLRSATAGSGISEIARRTLAYIRRSFAFTDAAGPFFDRELSKR